MLTLNVWGSGCLWGSWCIVYCKRYLLGVFLVKKYATHCVQYDHSVLGNELSTVSEVLTVHVGCTEPEGVVAALDFLYMSESQKNSAKYRQWKPTLIMA